MQMSPVQSANVHGNPTEISEKAVEQTSSASWQRQLADAVRSPQKLLQRLGFFDDNRVTDLTVETDFPLLVPNSFIARMEPRNPSDPLLLQVLPTQQETIPAKGFSSDPVDDRNARKAPGLLQKYQGRALLITTGTCAVHCRYCFRREYPYQSDPRRMDDWLPALEQIAADKTLSEVILSGGDPLVLNDDRLSKLVKQIDRIPHIERIRIHSRLPIVLPARVTDNLLTLLTSVRSRVVMVVHSNHGNEVVGDCADSLQRLVRSGIPVLNQAVLLKRVNDSVAALEALCRNLINIGVIPYYLHQLDRVQGAAHFEVPTERGLQLTNELAKRLPGYAVPRYVQEIPGALGKTPVI